jgi:DNA helicase MCM8
MSRSVRAPFFFSDQQRQYIDRLWKIQSREVQDARVDEQHAKQTTSQIDKHCLEKIAGIFDFLTTVLTRHLDHSNKDGQCENIDKNIVIETSLEQYISLFVESNKSIRLHTGKRTLTIHYDQFISELNRFTYGKDLGNGDEEITSSFGAFLYHRPQRALTALNVAMALAVVTMWKALHDASMRECEGVTDSNMAEARVNRFVDSCQILTRFVHVSPQLNMADIKTGLVNKFISVKGHVVKAKPRRLRVATCDFACQKCASIVPHSFEKGIFSVPNLCSSKDCKSRSFTLLRSTASYINVQEVRLQESQEESTSHAGRTPRQLEVELTRDLIDSCRPGDMILLSCWVDAVSTAVAARRTGKRAKETSTYKLYLIGHSVTTLSETNQQSNGGSKASSSEGSQITYTQQQLQNITQLCHADHRYFGGTERRAFPFDLLVCSVCPSIIGHHSVKAGILLCLLGGTPPASQHMDRGSTIRSNSHILIVGDPGMGKSQMLLAATQLAARSVYVGGNTASTTGLTVTLTKEEGGETGIEAGALVLADQGVACIDELDKCKNLDGLLEAMEQQCVSIAKAGVVATLPARCSIVAAANPKHGSYNMGKSVAENLNMARPVLSRFDLVFILRDRADEEQDRMVSNNIMNLYRKTKASTSHSASTDMLLAGDMKPNDGANEQATSESQTEGQRLQLEKRIAWVTSFNEPLPASLVRDYIAYAREYCKPKLTKEAALVLKKYFMELRYPENTRATNRYESIPITTRQLEALIRLAQARAKACLREFVLEEDALDVVELLKKSVEQVHTDERGLVDKYRVGAGGLSNRKLRLEFEKHLREIVGPGECTYQDLIHISARFDCPYSLLDTMIDNLRSDGFLLKKPNGKYSVAMV